MWRISSLALVAFVGCSLVGSLNPNECIDDAGVDFHVDGGPHTTEVSWSSCDIAAAYRVISLDSDAGQCPDLPMPGEQLWVEQTGAKTGVMTMRLTRIALELNDKCLALGQSCRASADGGVWATASVFLTAQDSKRATLRWSGERIDHHLLAVCPGSARVELEPLGAQCVGDEQCEVPPEPERLEVTCGSRPFVRTDGQCAPNDDCGKEACRCAPGSTCVGLTAKSCRQPCDYFNDTCPMGQRCDATYLARNGFCRPEGHLQVGAICANDNDCVAPLTCLIGRTAPATLSSGVCAPRCTEFDACPSGFQCTNNLNGSAVGGCLLECFRETDCGAFGAGRVVQVAGQSVCVCVPLSGVPTYGQSCRATSCAPNQVCRQYNFGTLISMITCIPKCTSDDDCPLDFPTCDVGLCE